MTETRKPCRTSQHCAHHGWCHRCAPDFAATMTRINIAIQRTDPVESHWGPLYEAVAGALLGVLPGPVDRATALNEAALGEAQQEIRRLGLMVDEYGAGASALTDKLKRVRDLHRETCILARGEVGKAAFRCSLCDVLDAPTQSPEEAHPPQHTWKVESPRRDQWASWGATYDEREWARESYESATTTAPGRPFRLVRATTTYTVEAEHVLAAAGPSVGGAQQQNTPPPVGYGDGKGRIFCVACPRPDGTPVPLTADDVDHWDLCPSCGRHVIDVARAKEADRD